MQILRYRSCGQAEHIPVQLQERGELSDQKLRRRVAAVVLDVVQVLRGDGLPVFFFTFAASSFWLSPAALRASEMIVPKVFMVSIF